VLDDAARSAPFRPCPLSDGPGFARWARGGAVRPEAPLSHASERADRWPKEPDRSLGTPGSPYPAPKDKLEFSAYKFHVVARSLDDVKNNTSQLVRAIIFLW